jgi:hypothetical protein
VTTRAISFDVRNAERKREKADSLTRSRPLHNTTSQHAAAAGLRLICIFPSTLHLTCHIRMPRF